MSSGIRYYEDFLSKPLKDHLLKASIPVAGVEGMRQAGPNSGLETTEALVFLRDLYLGVRGELGAVLERRTRDRAFVDVATLASVQLNLKTGRDVTDPDYASVIGMRDPEGRLVAGPRAKAPGGSPEGNPVAPLPDFLKGPHVTLFGPPGSAKMCINAMNSFHRKVAGEPPSVERLLAGSTISPKWGADDEDSKTPLREDLVAAESNLSGCFRGEISATEGGEHYRLAASRLALPIKRFPGLALPSPFLFVGDEPVPLHLYDFAIHLFHNRGNPEALTFYVPKLENEEEAGYLARMIGMAEERIRLFHPGYRPGTVRLMVVLENPRAVFRVNEIMDELHPYFAGASLGWHDYLASTARLFRNDPNYRIPVKADPDIVIKYIKASHELLSDVVGARGGIKVGGMYGVLPLDPDPRSDSFQLAMKGFVRDVITQMKRGLDGFWVAHPDFVRIGCALVEAWRRRESGDEEALHGLVRELLSDRHHGEILDFIEGDDVASLDRADPRYPRALLAADIKESDVIANNDPEEIRYNVFQSLQYLTDWLGGNGCVALPARIGGMGVRVMDDLATAERSRWEVWHEIRHGRFHLDDFLRIAFEELDFIRKGKPSDTRAVQVRWTPESAKWYPVALRIMVRLMTDPDPVEFATELLLPFTIPAIRESDAPWEAARALDPEKFRFPDRTRRFMEIFEACGSQSFAAAFSGNPVADPEAMREAVLAFSREEVLEAARFHGDIGESPATLDGNARSEQSGVSSAEGAVLGELRELGGRYLSKFGFKFLVAARGRSAAEILEILKTRHGNPERVELENAREALWEIARQRLGLYEGTGMAGSGPLTRRALEEVFRGAGVPSAALSLTDGCGIQTLLFGEGVTEKTLFQAASISKPVAAAFSLEFLSARGIPIDAPVNALLEGAGSSYRIPEAPWGDRVTVRHLLGHTAMNLHYVKGFAENEELDLPELLKGGSGYDRACVGSEPGAAFSYSGAGFMVLEHLIGALSGERIPDLTRGFLDGLGMDRFSFDPDGFGREWRASGVRDDSSVLEGGLRFPAFAAGAVSTPASLHRFFSALERAFHDPEGAGPLSHDTAVRMLHGLDLGSMGFMGCLMGLGVFVGVAGRNRFAVHQGANDGFRALSLHCFSGPDRGRGFTVMATSELKAVEFISRVAGLVFRHFGFSGIRPSGGPEGASFPVEGVAEEQIVNLGFKGMIFDAFEADLPEVPKRPPPAADSAVSGSAREGEGPGENLAAGARVVTVSDQSFGRAENLVSGLPPVFDPGEFGPHGKVMDSWETRRHNAAGVDWLILELKRPSPVTHFTLSTEFHDGNHVESVRVLGSSGSGTDCPPEWTELLSRTPLEGHSMKVREATGGGDGTWSRLRIEIFPDGGLTRLGVYDRPRALPAEGRFTRAIAKPVKPLSLEYDPSGTEIRKNLERALSGRAGVPVDVASLAFGGEVVHVSDEHYGPARQLLSPYPPIHMFDGFESRRSRGKGHFEDLIIHLGSPAIVSSVEFDFTHFIHNNPEEIEVWDLGCEGKNPLVPRTRVKEFAGNRIRIPVRCDRTVKKLRLRVHPDGGINRFHVYGTLSGKI